MKIWLVLALVACGSNSSKPDALLISDARSIDARSIDARSIDAAIDARIVLVDAPTDSGLPGVCNILTQTGCNAGEKCAWFEDGQGVGHIGCAPDGAVALGGACTYGPPGTTGYDNCSRGAVCIHAQCETICDQSGGTPMCDATHSCEVYAGFLGPLGSEAAGVCDPSCHPLDDNDFDGSGSALTKPGTVCAADQGCYGFWSSTMASHFSCAPVPAGSTMLFHRTACTTASGCANPGGTPYLNGCAQGYMPEISDDQAGANTYVCLAFCKPADCYAGNCGTLDANRVGAAPHRCNVTDARGTFNAAANGDQCVYGWWFEEDSTGMVHKSQYSDTTGFCIDHTKYHLLDSTMTVSSQTPWPACSTLPLTATSTTCAGATATGSADLSGCTAVDFGCVSTTTGNVPAAPHHPHRPLLRPLYHRAL